MNDPSDEDDLTKRFKAIFNKDPVSRSPGHSEKWTSPPGTYEIDEEEVLPPYSGTKNELGKLVEESAALNDEDVKELIGLSSDAVKKGKTSLPEAQKLLREVETAKRESHSGHDEVSEDEIAALLKQLGDNNDEDNIPSQDPSKTSNDDIEKQDPPDKKGPGNDDSEEIAAVLSQLADEAHLESKFEESSSSSPFPSVSKLPLPSLSSDTADDDFLSRISNLKNLSASTGKSGVINTFIPSLAKPEDEDMENWCGMSFLGMWRLICRYL